MRYATPMAFKEALEARLRAEAGATGQDQNRLRMRLLMDRFATRIGQEYGQDVVLKGGVVMELRMEGARSTKDLDLHLTGNPSQTLVRLQRAGRSALGDHLIYEVQPDPRHPRIEVEGMRYEGLRFRVKARLAGKIFGGPFGLDAAFAEPLVREPELLLPDIALLAQVRSIQATTLRDALDRTFAHRALHAVPAAMPEAPEAWRAPYARIASRDRLPWVDLRAVMEAAGLFLDPVLAGRGGVWKPEAWRWEPERRGSTAAAPGGTRPPRQWNAKGSDSPRSTATTEATSRAAPTPKPRG